MLQGGPGKRLPNDVIPIFQNIVAWAWQDLCADWQALVTPMQEAPSPAVLGRSWWRLVVRLMLSPLGSLLNDHLDYKAILRSHKQRGGP